MEYSREKQIFSTRECRYIVLTIYDITETKRRNKMVTCLEKYGVRVQKSAFEAVLNRKMFHQLAQEACQLIDVETDSLRIYLLASNTSVCSWGIGISHTEEVIIF